MENGARLSISQTPEVAAGKLTAYNQFWAISATSTQDIWLAGEFVKNPINGDISSMPLIEHWNGQQWQTVPERYKGRANLQTISVSLASSGVAVPSMTMVTLSLPQPASNTGETRDGRKCQRTLSPVSHTGRTPFRLVRRGGAASAKQMTLLSNIMVHCPLSKTRSQTVALLLLAKLRVCSPAPRVLNAPRSQ